MTTDYPSERFLAWDAVVTYDDGTTSRMDISDHATAKEAHAILADTLFSHPLLWSGPGGEYGPSTLIPNHRIHSATLEVRDVSIGS